MRSRQQILDDSRQTIQTYTPDTNPIVHTNHLLLEVWIDIRDALITDAKDAMNALIEIRKNH